MCCLLSASPADHSLKVVIYNGPFPKVTHTLTQQVEVYSELTLDVIAISEWLGGSRNDTNPPAIEKPQAMRQKGGLDTVTSTH